MTEEGRNPARLQAVSESGQPVISANSAEKPKRGRPQLFPPEYERIMRSCGGFENQRRANQDEYHSYAAIGALFSKHPQGEEYGQAAFGWLGNPSITNGRLRKTILAELGRLGDADTIRTVATRICELKPKTVEAVRIIRESRTGKAAPASVDGLQMRVIRALNEYAHQHPDTTYDMMRDALNSAIDAVDTTEDEPGD